MLEQLIEPTGTFSLVDHWFIMEEYNWDQPDGKDAWNKDGEGGGASVLSLNAPLSPNLLMVINLRAPQTLSFWGLWKLRYTGMVA